MTSGVLLLEPMMSLLDPSIYEIAGGESEDGFVQNVDDLLLDRPSPVQRLSTHSAGVPHMGHSPRQGAHPSPVFEGLVNQ